jgi:hypothetical protein
MKTVGILQPGYLPWLGFFEQQLRSEVFVIYDDVQYDKHGWRNRNRIKGSNGPVWLTVPVRTTGKNKPIISDVVIDTNQSNWGKRHCGSIKQFYGKTPFFSDYFYELERVLKCRWVKLMDLNMELIKMLATWLDVKSNIIFSSQLGCHDDDPSRRLVEICKALGADIFYEGAAGRDYLRLEMFDEAEIKVVFQDYRCRIYPQPYGDFVAHLSAIDVLMNCGPSAKYYVVGNSDMPADHSSLTFT